MTEIKELVESISDSQIIDLVVSLGSTEYRETQDAIIFKTICHNCDEEDASFKLYYYRKSKMFHCYTECSCSFDIVELFRKRYELLDIDYKFNDIIKKLGGKAIHQNQSFYNHYETIYNERNDYSNIKLPSINKGLLNIYQFYPTQEWLDDGISIDMMRTYNILYSSLENKIIIPHYDVDGNLIGIRGRALNEEDLLLGKYMPVQIEGKIYSHPLAYNLYGINLVKDNIKKFKMAIVAESEKASLQYGTMFGQNNNICVSVCGSQFNKYQLQLLMKCGAKKVLIAFDKEGETWKEQEKYFNKLSSICDRYKNYCTMGFIYDTKNLLKLKQSPFDCGAAITKELIKGAVWR